jgi:opacity protein-like surface antigen
MNRRRMICVALFAAIVAVRVEAQTTSPAPGRLQVSVGAGWLGGAEFGEQPADLRTASSSAYRLFQSDTHLGGTGLFEARVGFALTKRYAIEGRAAIASPELQTTVSSDAEASGSFTAVEGIDQYIFDGGVLVRLDEWQAFGLTPFAIGGVGYVRQLHEDRQLVETGHLFYVGGGVMRGLFARSQGFIRSGSIRADLRLNVLSLELEDDSRPQGSVSASLVLTF